jgi:hypothetical protein
MRVRHLGNTTNLVYDNMFGYEACRLWLTTDQLFTQRGADRAVSSLVDAVNRVIEVYSNHLVKLICMLSVTIIHVPVDTQLDV